MLSSKLCHSFSLFSSPSSVRGTWTGGQQTVTRQMSALMCLWVAWEWGRSDLGMRQLAWRWDGVVWEWGRNDLLLAISSLVDGLSSPVCCAELSDVCGLPSKAASSSSRRNLQWWVTFFLLPLPPPPTTTFSPQFHPQYTSHISHSERLILTRFLGGFVLFFFFRRGSCMEYRGWGWSTVSLLWIYWPWTQGTSGKGGIV